MDQDEIQKRIESFLQELGVPSFIIFGWKKDGDEFGIVSSHHHIPVNVVIKGLSWAMHDFINRTL